VRLKTVSSPCASAGKAARRNGVVRRHMQSTALLLQRRKVRTPKALQPGRRSWLRHSFGRGQAFSEGALTGPESCVGKPGTLDIQIPCWRDLRLRRRRFETGWAGQAAAGRSGVPHAVERSRLRSGIADRGRTKSDPRQLSPDQRIPGPADAAPGISATPAANGPPDNPAAADSSPDASAAL